MNQVTRLSVLNILVLKTYLTSIYGDHWPLEIIQIICMLFYKLFNVKISCGLCHTCLIFDNEVYMWAIIKIRIRRKNSIYQMLRKLSVEVIIRLLLQPITKSMCGVLMDLANWVWAITKIRIHQKKLKFKIKLLCKKLD